MPRKKPPKKSPAKRVKAIVEKELKDSDLDSVAGGTTTEPVSSTSLEDADSRKRPGRVKSLHPDS